MIYLRLSILDAQTKFGFISEFLNIYIYIYYINIKIFITYEYINNIIYILKYFLII